MRTNSPAFVATLLAVLGVGMGACHTTSTIPGGAQASFNTFTGNLSTIAEASLDDTYTASQAGVTDLEFTIESKAKDAMKALIAARTADKSSVNITLERQSDHVTGISISVGALGNETTARMVLDKIMSHIQK